MTVISTATPASAVQPAQRQLPGPNCRFTGISKLGVKSVFVNVNAGKLTSSKSVILPYLPEPGEALIADVSEIKNFIVVADELVVKLLPPVTLTLIF